MYLNITQISNDKKIQDAFIDIIQSIISKYTPQKIMLFGSYARGDAHEGSDIDLMLIKETSKRFIDRIADVIRLNNTLISLEPLVYSPLEFETMKKEKRDFIMTIEEEGIEIYDARSTKMADSNKNQLIYTNSS
ncbi:MAG: nucleotidyltransferase domain-containing protein [Candidatus Methanoperedens sp.]